VARTSPLGRRRHLSRQLLHLREESGRTADDVARHLGWTPSTITRIERNDWRLPKLHLVEALLDVYGVTGDRRAELLGYATQARQRGWWERRLGIAGDYGTYIALEHEATTLRTFAAMRIPTLLQTPDYCRAVHATKPAAHVDAYVHALTERQRLLTDPDPVVLRAVIWQAALHHQVAGPQVQAAQLEHLLTVSELPNVIVQVLPFTAGPIPAAGGFTHLTFPAVIDPEAVFVLSVTGAAWVEDPSEVTRYSTTFERLLHVSATVAESRALIAARASDLRRAQRD
jgi:transcriptional regulator with XRE-family HTH domain